MSKRELHRLTAKKVDHLKAPGRYGDGGGLYLQVSPTTTKAWLFRYMREGRAREMGLGSLTAVQLALAREKAQQCRRLVAEGVDPIEARDASTTQLRLAGARAKSFRDCADAYIAAHRSGWKSAKHAAQWTSTLKAYADKALGAVVVDKIDTPLVLKVLEPIWHEKPETASRVRGRIESVLDWATVRGYREGANPARWKGHLDHMLPNRSKVAKVRHHPALPFDQMGTFMKKLRAETGFGAQALEFIILTAARTGEAIGARWDEVDLHGRVWTVPAERMKAKRIHKVPLSKPVVRLLKALKETSKGDFVFPGQRGRKPLSNMACLKVLERMKRDDLTVHGFRSTFRDWAAERTSFAREVAEAALAHVVGDKVEAAYRRGDLFEKRIKLMETWAQHCEKVSTATIHSLAGRQRAKSGRKDKARG